MCLAVPGKLVSVSSAQPLLRTGRVSFGGIIKEVNLAFAPEAMVGNWVLVHAGIAIGVIDDKEVEKTLEYFAQIDRDEYRE